ncbi:hypothetical protein [uncultured Nostoc sp.]|uniref:hypothetical protein n=1 Tax=uncultured Nostoc sp. TaxID=340711 RepID=UPI0035C95B83
MEYKPSPQPSPQGRGSKEKEEENKYQQDSNKDKSCFSLLEGEGLGVRAEIAKLASSNRQIPKDIIRTCPQVKNTTNTSRANIMGMFKK